MSARTHATSPPGALRGLALWMLTGLAAMTLAVASTRGALDVATPRAPFVFGLTVGFLAGELLLVRLGARASVVRAALRG